MDAEITKALSDIDKKLSHQELMHKDIDVGTHGTVSIYPAVIFAIGISALVTIFILNSNKKIKQNG